MRTPDLTTDDAGVPTEGSAPPRRRAGGRRRPLLALLAAVCLVGLLVVALALSSALSAARSLERAQQGLTGLTVGGVDSGIDAALDGLETAQRHVDDAARQLDRLPVRTVAAVPVLGRSLRAEQHVARTSVEVVDAALLAADRLPTLAPRDGGLDVDAVQRLQEDLGAPVARARTELEALRGTSTRLTPAPVGAGVDRALRGLEPAVLGLEDAVLGLGLAHGVLGGAGERSLMVALANNAELRGAGGFMSSFALGRTVQGRLELGEVQDIRQVAEPPETARRVAAPREYAEDFGPLAGDTTQFGSWNMSPHAPDSAEVGARVVGALVGQQPDVVVILDVPAMAALSALGGGVVLPDGTAVAADELEDALLVDAYAGAGRDDRGQERRRGELQAAASQAVTRLLSADVSAVEVVRALSRAAAGRHLTVWSARPDEQAALERLGLAGALRADPGEDLVHVSVNNVGANKLDYYVRREVAVDVVLDDGSAEVVQRVRFVNEAPEQLVPYVAGSGEPGRTVSRVELSVPASAEVGPLLVDGQDTGTPVRRGAVRSRLALRLELPRGASQEVEVRYRLPLTGDAYRLHLVPQALAQDATLDVTVRRADGGPLGVVTGAEVTQDQARRDGAWSETEVVEVRPEDTPLGAWEAFRRAVARFWDEPVRLPG